MIDKQSLKVLKIIYSKKLTVKEIAAKLKLNKEDAQKLVNFLNSEKYIELELEGLYSFFGDNNDRIVNYKASEKGRAYIENIKIELLTHWIPYAVTTLIAIAALINSILARLAK